MFVIKLVGFFQVRFFEKARVFFKETQTKKSTYGIVHRISEHSREKNQEQQQGQAEQSSSCQGARRKEQRISRQKRRDDEPGFGKDDEKENRIGKYPILGDHGTQRLINLQNKMYQEARQIQKMGK